MLNKQRLCKNETKQMESYNSNIIWPLEGREVMQTEFTKSSAEFVNSWSVGSFLALPSGASSQMSCTAF